MHILSLFIYPGLTKIVNTLLSNYLMKQYLSLVLFQVSVSPQSLRGSL